VGHNEVVGLALTAADRATRGRVQYRLLQLVLIALLATRTLLKIVSGAGMSWDFVNFYNAGRRIFEGQLSNLYAPPLPVAGEPAAANGLLQYVGFPISALVFAPLGALPARWALVALKAACAVCFGLGLVVIYQHCRERVGGIWRSDAALCIYLILILLFEPFWFVFAIGGQATPLAFLLLAVTMVAYTAGRFWPAAACLSVVILMKPAMALAGMIFVFAGAWPLLTRLTACLAAEATLSWMVFGWQRHLEWVQMVFQESRRWAVPWWNNSAILGAVANWWIYAGRAKFDPVSAPAGFGQVQAVLRVLLVVQFFWMVRRARGPEWTPEGRRQHQVLLALLFPLFFSTVVWPHYLAIAFIPLVVLAAHFSLLPRLGRLLLVAAFLSTIRTNLRVTAWLTDALPSDRLLRILLMSLFGASTLLLMLTLLIAFGDRLRRLDPRSSRSR
jgi:Glycosyltransferase family 87